MLQAFVMSRDSRFRLIEPQAITLWSGFRSTWLTEAALALWLFEQITPFK
jgi:hypothetical protein